jgi:hypothetical protein
MKKPAQHLIAEVPRRQAKVEITIGVDLGDVWSHYCTLRGRGVKLPGLVTRREAERKFFLCS